MRLSFFFLVFFAVVSTSCSYKEGKYTTIVNPDTTSIRKVGTLQLEGSMESYEVHRGVIEGKELLIIVGNKQIGITVIE